MAHRSNVRTRFAVFLFWLLAWVVGITLLSLAAMQAAVTPQGCQTRKMKLAGKYVLCRTKAEARAVRAGTVADYVVCDAKLAQKWQALESRAAGACPTAGDLSAVQLRGMGQADTIIAALTGNRFVDNANGTVLDTWTGLMWEQTTAANMEDYFDWYTAMSEHVSAVNGYGAYPTLSQPGLGGFSDWRMPTIAELGTIVDCSGGAPCIDPIFGPAPVIPYYWSSTTATVDTTQANYVGLYIGNTAISSKDFLWHARAVRRAG